MKKVIYLAAGRARIVLPGYSFTYNDIKEKSDLMCDMMSVDLSDYDVIIASPPCNYYSRANYQRDSSYYALSTKHLLPDIIQKLIILDKPFIVENVRNFNLFSKLNFFNFNCFIYFHGRHTYFTNRPFNPQNIPQEFDFYTNKNGFGCRKHFYCQGGNNVNSVIKYWLQTLNFS